MRRLSLVLAAILLVSALFVLPPVAIAQGWSYTFDFSFSNGGWVASSNGVYQNGRWESEYNPGNGDQLLLITRSFDSSTLTSVRVVGVAGDTGFAATRVIQYASASQNISQAAGAIDVTLTSTQTATLITVSIDTDDTPSNINYITLIVVTGTGTNPFVAGSPTLTPQPTQVLTGWTKPLKTYDTNANLGYGAVWKAYSQFADTSVFAAGKNMNIAYSTSVGLPVHSIYAGTVESVVQASCDTPGSGGLNGFCIWNLAEPYNVDLTPARAGDNAISIVTVELASGLKIRYAVASPTVSEGQEIGAGCVIGQSFAVREVFGIIPQVYEVTYGATLFQGINGSASFDIYPSLTDEPSGGPCAIADLESRSCRLVANSEFSAAAGVWNFESGPGAPSTYALGGRGLWLTGGVSQDLNLDPGVDYVINLIYRKLVPNPLAFEVTLGNEIPLSIHETSTGVGTPITYVSTPAQYDPTSTGGGGNFYNFKLKANSVLSDPEIQIDYACISEDGEGDVQPPGGCLIYNNEFDAGQTNWSFSGTVPPAFFAGIALLKGNASIGQDIKLFPKGGGPQTYKITAVARRVGAPAAGEYIDIDWAWGAVDSGSMGPFSDYTFRTASDDTFVVSAESTETLTITIDVTNSASSDMLQIDSLCITTEDGVPVPGYQRAPVITAACKQCAYVPTGDVNEDITEYVQWLACFLSQLWECAFKSVLAGIWTVLSNILSFLAFFRLWLGYTFENGATWTNGNVTVVANWFNGQFLNLGQRIENALINVRFGTVITASGAGFWDVLLELIRQVGGFFDGVFNLLRDVIDAIENLGGSFISLVVSLLGLLANFVIAGIGTLVGGAVNMIAALYNGFNSALVSPIPGALTCDQPGTMLYYPCLGMYILDNTAFAGPAAYLLPIALGIVAIRLLLWGLGKIRAVIAGVAA